MRTLAQDLKYALRTLGRSPIFLLVAVASLALGIGANTAIFSLVDQLLLRLLPVKNPQELVLLTSRGNFYGNNTGGNAMAYRMYTDIRDNNKVFSGMFARFATPFAFSIEGKTERIQGELVTGNFFPVLGVTAAAGRVFGPSDDLYQGQHPQAVISYAFWESHFARDPSAIGRKILINGYPFTIIGVSQKDFSGVDPSRAQDIRIPMMMKMQVTRPDVYNLNDRRSRFANVFGRLKPGVTLTQAKAGLQPFYHSILESDVKDKAFARASKESRDGFLKGWVDVLPAGTGRSDVRRQATQPLWILMGVVGLVLVIACANLANLLVARAAARQKEIAMRIALGAGRGRLIRQLLAESLLLSVLGGIAGLALAIAIDSALLKLLPDNGGAKLALSATPDLRILLFTTAVSLLTALLFGLVPALQASKTDLATTLKDLAGSVVTGGSATLRKILVVAQVTLSLTLLIGAGLFVSTLRNLRGSDPGFAVDQLVSFKVDPSRSGYPDPRARQFFRDLTTRLRNLPGVTGAGLAIVPLLDGDEWDSTMTVEGYERKTGENMNPHMQYVTPGFFATIGQKLLVGRDFNDNDQFEAPKVAIVNQKFATKYFGAQSPLGRHIGYGGDPGTKTDITIAGVVSDTKYEDMRQEIPREVYIPYVQNRFVTEMTAYVRTGRGSDQFFTALRGEVRALDPNLPVYDVRTLDEQVDQSLILERMVATLSAVFGGLATFLAAIGLYGVMAYTVTRRTREIGIRVALGAGRAEVMWLVMREALVLLGIGLAAGLPSAWMLTQVVKSQLYGVAPHDPAAIAAGVLLISLIALAAAWAPGRRATLIHPTEALRCE
jgi:predicted permease